jgi:hypothetical protein
MVYRMNRLDWKCGTDRKDMTNRHDSAEHDKNRT